MTVRSHHRLLPLPKWQLNPALSVRAASRRWISHQDRLELEDLLCNPYRDSSVEWSLARLRDLLQRARFRPASQLPGDTVRLGSSCAVQAEHLDETLRFVLTLPAAADPGRGRVSVLSPVGLAVLGRRQGQECPAIIPGGQGQFRLLSVSAPSLPHAPAPDRTNRTASRRRAFRVRQPLPVLPAAKPTPGGKVHVDLIG